MARQMWKRHKVMNFFVYYLSPLLDGTLQEWRLFVCFVYCFIPYTCHDFILSNKHKHISIFQIFKHVSLFDTHQQVNVVDILIFIFIGEDIKTQRV